MIAKLKSLKKHQGFMKYFKNTSWLFAEKILRMVVGLFVGIWVARYLEPEQFGTFNYIQSFVILFIAFAMLGLDSIVVKELVQDSKNKDNILGTSFILKLVSSFLILATLPIILSFSSNTEEINNLIFLLTCTYIFNSLNVIDFYLQSKILSKYTVFINIFILLCSSVLKIYFILNNIPLEYFIYLLLLESVMMGLFLLVIYKKILLFNILLWKFDISLAIKMLRQSLPLLMGGVAFTLFTNIDNIMIHELLNDEQVGIYSAASKLVLLWHFLPGIVLSSLMPSIVSSYENKELFFSRMYKVFLFLFIISLILSTTYYLFNFQIISYTFGYEYMQSSQILAVLAWSNIFIFFNSAWNYWMIVENNTKYTLYFHLLTGILNIILNYFLILSLGTIGAAYALVLSLLISFTIFFIFKKGIFYMFISTILFSPIYKGRI